MSSPQKEGVDAEQGDQCVDGDAPFAYPERVSFIEGKEDVG